MAGTGRWAERRHRPRSFGHREGQKAVRAAVEFCRRRGVEALTLFAFSSENWSRPQSEVGALMQLFLKALDREVEELHSNQVRIRFVGDLSAFAPDLRERMQAAMERTTDNSALHLNVAVNYGGRWDIARAAAQLAARGEPLTEANLDGAMALSHVPDPDLFIRTGGEQRLSNFLLWQSAYAELFFSDRLWPEFDEAALDEAIEAYRRRERRFGQTSAQVTGGARHDPQAA